MREVQVGTGGWSQCSPVQVLAVPEGPGTRIDVRWPGGKTQVAHVPMGTKEIKVNMGGQAQAR